jgi:hypothetical protein
MAPLIPEDPEEIGGFTVEGRIGAGGMGTVYGARRGRGPYVALKVIRTDLTGDADFRRRFAREILLLQRVHSRTVPAVVATGRLDGGSPWLATEFVPGQSLSEHVRAFGPLPSHLLDGLAVGTAEALRAIHAAGVVHRDLKPGNVMLAPDGPKVLDFGIARALDETATPLPGTGGLVGTPGWMAPELLRGETPTRAADVFAWGALVAYAATGRPPFGTGAPDALAHRVTREPPDLDGVPDRLLPVLATALDREPTRRPTAAELAVSLSGYAGPAGPDDGEAVAAAVGALLDRIWTGVEGTVPAPPKAPSRGHARALLAAGAAVLLLVTVAGGVLASRALHPRAADGADGAPGGDGTSAGAAPGDRGANEDAAPGGDRSADGASEDWEPPELTGSGTNAEWFAEVDAGTDGARPAFTATPDSGASRVTVAVESVEAVPGGVRFTLRADPLRVDLDGGMSDMFTVPTPERPITPAEEVGAVGEGEEFALTFPGAPEQGPLTFTGADYVPGVAGIPPVTYCYDAAAGDAPVPDSDCY